MNFKNLIKSIPFFNRCKEEDYLYKLMFSKSSLINLIIDAKTGNIIKFNDAALKFYGYTREEFSKVNYSEIDLAFVPIDSVNYLTNKYPDYNFKSTHKIKYGKIKNVEVFFTVITYKSKKLIHATISDITEKVKTENEFISQMKRNTELLSYIPYLAFEINSTGLILEAYNGSLLDEVSSEIDFVGKKLVDVVSIGELNLTKAINNIFVNNESTVLYTRLKFDDKYQSLYTEIKPTENFNILVLMLDSKIFVHEKDNNYI